MEWKVVNALNRDVERQHLNKILKEIEAAVKVPSSDADAPTDVKSIVASMLEGNREVGIDVDYDPVREVINFSIVPFTLRLVGDVTGTATVSGLGNMTLDTTLELDAIGVEEAPMDGLTYWRRSGEWEQVADIVTALENVSGAGFAVINGSSWEIRSFAAVSGELVVTNPTGVGGNPTYGLADVPNSGEGDGVVRTYTRDSKGRIEGDEAATTDNLPEGTVNLYYTKERAQSPVVDLPEVSTVVVDPSLKGSWLETSPVNDNLQLAGSWSRGDELSIHAQNRLALVGGAVTLTSRTGTYPVAESFGSVVHIKFISPTLARVWGDLSGTPNSFNLLTEAGDFLMTESGDNLVVL